MQILKIQKGLQRTCFYFQHINGKVFAVSDCYEKTQTEFTAKDIFITLMHLQNHVANQECTSSSSVQIKFSWFQD